jgi:hypothetical protein
MNGTGFKSGYATFKLYFVDQIAAFVDTR